MTDLACAALIWSTAFVLLIFAFIAFTLNTILRSLMSVQEVVDALVVQVGKVKDELVNRLAELQLQVDAAGVAEKVDLSELSAAIQSLDDIGPDAEADQPAE